MFPTGGIVWRYRYRIGGRREKLTLGKYPALTLKNARIKRDEAAQTAAMDKSPAKQKQLAKLAGADATTVAEFGKRFLFAGSGGQLQSPGGANGGGNRSVHQRINGGVAACGSHFGNRFGIGAEVPAGVRGGTHGRVR